MAPRHFAEPLKLNLSAARTPGASLPLVPWAAAGVPSSSSCSSKGKDHLTPLVVGKAANGKVRHATDIASTWNYSIRDTTVMVTGLDKPNMSILAFPWTFRAPVISLSAPA